MINVPVDYRVNRIEKYVDKSGREVLGTGSDAHIVPLPGMNVVVEPRTEGLDDDTTHSFLQVAGYRAGPPNPQRDVYPVEPVPHGERPEVEDALEDRLLVDRKYMVFWEGGE